MLDVSVWLLLVLVLLIYFGIVVFFFQAEDGIRDLVRSRGLGDVYKRQGRPSAYAPAPTLQSPALAAGTAASGGRRCHPSVARLLYTSDAAGQRSSVDLGGRRLI